MQAPSSQHIAAAIVCMQNVVCSQARAKTYDGIAAIYDCNGAVVGHQVCKLLRLITRYLLSVDPPKCSDKTTLVSSLLHVLSEKLNLSSYVPFFQWVFQCKLGDRTMGANMFRVYTVCCDSGISAVTKALRAGELHYFGMFTGFSYGQIEVLPRAKKVFLLAKDYFFDCMGFSAEQYNNNLKDVRLTSNGKLQVGMSMNFFPYAMFLLFIC